jgi:hypothetical protein
MGAHGGQGIAPNICDGVIWRIHHFTFKWVHEQRILVVMLNGMPFSRIHLPNDTESLAREFSCDWAAEVFSNGLAAVSAFRRDIR